jgi:hypothetical protein
MCEPHNTIKVWSKITGHYFSFKMEIRISEMTIESTHASSRKRVHVICSVGCNPTTALKISIPVPCHLFEMDIYQHNGSR